MSTGPDRSATRATLAVRYALTPEQFSAAAVDAFAALAEAGLLADGPTPHASLARAVAPPSDVLARLDGLALLLERLSVDALAIHSLLAPTASALNSETTDAPNT